jgi:transcriptional regulator with XRE-family HTH domain
MNNFSTYIKQVLKEQQISQRKASEICGIAPQQFGNYVSGKNIPSFQTALDIIDKLNWKILVFPKLNNND